MSTTSTTGRLFTFALLGAFALLGLLAAVVGGRAYATIVDNSEANGELRTCMGYIASKVRSSDEAGAIDVISGDGVKSVLTLTGEYGEAGERYTTYIYESGGYVREYFARADREFDPENGERLLAANALDFALEDGKLRVSARVGALERTLLLRLRCQTGTEAHHEA